MNWRRWPASSNVHSTAHDGENLWVRFRRGGNRTAHYRYDGMPSEEYAGMLKNPFQESIGTHLHKKVYPFYKGVFVKEEQDS